MTILPDFGAAASTDSTTVNNADFPPPEEERKMERNHPMSNVLLSVAAAVVLGAGTTAAMATEPCGDFGACKALVEINATDGDIGFHFLVDGDDLNSIRLHDPNGGLVFEVYV